jgi:aminomethyltransferase
VDLVEDRQPEPAEQHFGALREQQEIEALRRGDQDLGRAPEHARALWDALMAAGEARGIRPIGFGALEMARIEAGLLLPDSEFVNAEFTLRVNRAHTPFELGMEWLVDMEGQFTGRRALLQQQK